MFKKVMVKLFYAEECMFDMDWEEEIRLNKPFKRVRMIYWWFRFGLKANKRLWFK